MQKKIINILIVMIFMTFSVAMAITTICTEDEEFSYHENRELVTKKDINLDNFKEKFEVYVVDNFPNRNHFMEAYSNIEYILQKVNSRYAYIIDDFILTYDYAVPDHIFDVIMNRINYFATVNPEMNVIYVTTPSKSFALWEILQDYTDITNSLYNLEKLENTLNNDLTHINIAREIYENTTLDEKKDMYFVKDFHWNFNGFDYASRFMLEQMIENELLPDISLDDLPIEVREIEREFLGDLAKRYSYLSTPFETIKYYETTENFRYYLSFDKSLEVSRNDLISKGLDKEKVEYSDVYTENIGFYRVENSNSLLDENIVIFKDSYQNPTTDIFSSIYKNTYIIDPRYVDNLSLLEIINLTNTTNIMFFYHQSNASVDLMELLIRE